MQGELFDNIPELRFCEGIFTKCRDIAKSRLPMPVKGETIDEYREELRDETRLEFAYRLRKLADDIEKSTLERQKNLIEYFYKDINARE